jgi:hypothetical protein
VRVRSVDAHMLITSSRRAGTRENNLIMTIAAESKGPRKAVDPGRLHRLMDSPSVVNGTREV